MNLDFGSNIIEQNKYFSERNKPVFGKNNLYRPLD